MAIINYTDQIRYTGKGYLDAKMMPVKSVDDLKNISLTQRFEGLTITVLNDGNPQDYWLVGGITNNCWIPKTGGNGYSDLKLVLEDGFLKLMDDNIQLGEKIDLNEFFPEQPSSPENPNDLYIESVDYSTSNENNVNGIFMCFTYSDNTKKYLDMSQFVQNTYEQGSGIVINGNVISIDEAIIGRISSAESSISELSERINVEKKRIDELNSKIDVNIKNVEDSISDLTEELSNEKEIRENEHNAINASISDISSRLDSLKNKVDSNFEEISQNKESIEKNKTEINVLKERVNALSSAAEGSTPDGITIGITDDEQKALYVKISNKDGNMIAVENGLYASIPVFYEDEELN